MRTLGKIFLFLIVIVAAVVGYLVWQWKVTNNETKAYLDKELPVILSSWNPQDLISRVSPEFTHEVKPEEVTALFTKLSLQYGKLVSYDGSAGSGSFSINYTTADGKVWTGKCTANATFANGGAEIKVTLVKHGAGPWQIMNFGVDPK